MGKSTGPICQGKATRCLKIPLRSSEQIYLVFLIPVIVGCSVYVLNLAADVVVAVQHFREGNPIWGSCTIAIIYAPAIAYFALTVSRPDWWMTEDEKIAEGVFSWFVLQLCQLVAFPLFALYRYAGLIVLIVDAIKLTGDERMKTLNAAAAPAAIELYFFLQAWFQAAPQAVFQTHLIFREYSLERTHQTVMVHMLCIVMSIVVLSIETASFQRFESQRVNGRKLPWAMWLKKYRDQELGNLDEKKPLQQLQQQGLTEVPSTVRSSVAPLIDPTDDSTAEENPSEIRSSAVTTPPRINLERQISTTPPLPPKNAHIRPPPTPIRGITTVASLPVPEMPAPPRPDSIVAKDTANSSESPEAPSPGRTVGIESTGSSSPEPNKSRWRGLRVPTRKYSVKGLDEDDPVGKFVAFVWWFFFILARVFAIAIFYEFYRYWLLGLVGCHYALTLAFLFYHAKYYDVNTFFVNLWLGLVYVFSAIEYRVKFKYADIWLFTYYTLVIVQNSIMTVTWFVYADWYGFWYTYMFFAIFGSMGLCVISASVYNVLFKPKKRRVYAS